MIDNNMDEGVTVKGSRDVLEYGRMKHYKFRTNNIFQQKNPGFDT